MERLSGFPYFPVQFNKGAEIHDLAPVEALKAHLVADEVTDLVVISHGWNNDMDEAHALYAAFFENARTLLQDNRLPSLSRRKISVLGVLWPSKKFADRELIPSGAASVQSTVDLDEVREKLDALKGAFDDRDSDAKLAKLRALLPKLEDSDAKAREFIDVMRSLVRTDDVDSADASLEFFALPAGELLQRLQQPVSFSAHGFREAGGGAAIDEEQGGAAGLGSFFSGIASGIRNALNFTTYYQMKTRAGLVGAKGVHPILKDIAARHGGLRVHLVGHSFGGRLVTALAAGPDESSAFKVASMSLLQAAFSHYGLAEKWDGAKDGAFRRIVTRNTVSGPIIVTCTANDKAVGLAYPIASLIAQQVGANLGDENDKYGGIGRNGAQKTPEAENEVLLAVGRPYSFIPGRIYNLKTSEFIKDHGDVANPVVAYAVLSAIASSA